MDKPSHTLFYREQTVALLSRLYVSDSFWMADATMCELPTSLQEFLDGWSSLPESDDPEFQEAILSLATEHGAQFLAEDAWWVSRDADGQRKTLIQPPLFFRALGQVLLRPTYPGT